MSRRFNIHACPLGQLFVAVVLFYVFSTPCKAQNMSLSTNLLDYANFMTLNAEGSYALDRHWSATAQLRYNPFSYSIGGNDVQNKQQAYAAGLRYWPWHVYSGWWMEAQLQYQEYNSGGISSAKTREGDRYGLGAAAGYSHMLRERLNLEFGIGLWGGWDKYVVYNCPVCGLTEESGEKVFFLPNELIFAISYVF